VYAVDKLEVAASTNQTKKQKMTTAIVKSVIIVEDESIIREALYHCLDKESSIFQRVYRYAGIRELMEAIIPDDEVVILLDVMLKGVDGIESIGEIRSKWKNARIIIVSNMTSPETISRAFSRGAIGFFDKGMTPQQTRDNLLGLLRGGSPISPLIAQNLIGSFNMNGELLLNLRERENQILQGILDGLSYQEIGERFSISIDSVRKYVKSLYTKFDVHSKSELISKFHRFKSSGK
jgi:DNA-binding NarL/FixJ family response regulator